MSKILSKTKSLMKEIDKEVRTREKYFLSKPESWQDSVTGDKYSVKTETLRELSQMIEEGLSGF